VHKVGLIGGLQQLTPT